ncbi:MAG: glycoside hydrolase family 1 protein [Candidatus Pacebacteria bacterium]|nr:glycoside hydrolase family 1 protein [Candidatus Paceibacterota bacterium]MCF7857542.1 glycoside hydrolase family 1 protein [Candidatus Paceibacterota bacterium]
MQQPDLKKFPEGFIWGAATASYQVEGGIMKTDWARAAEDGRVPFAGKACDHYNRYEEDFDIAKSLGHTGHRFSIEWARIEPEDGVFNEEAIAHYRKVLEALHVRGVKPFVTLWHFTLPLWFSETGGFERKDAPEIFARYCSYVVSRLGDLCTDFSTMNEPNVFASNGWLRGSWPPFKRFVLTDIVSITNSGRSFESKAERGLTPLFTYLRVICHLAKAHNCAYEAIKKVSPLSDVSVVKHVILFRANWNPINKAIAWIANYFWTYRFMNRVYMKCDSIGLNYYFQKKFGDKKVYEKTDMDWDIYPEGLEESLMMLARYRKPLFVSESGIADYRDVYRGDYITKQVQATWQAIQRGADVRGHMYWSLLDNYEWVLGYEKRFGLVEINYETLERTIRPSAYIYKQICQQNGV